MFNKKLTEWGGLCFCDLGVNYGTTRPNNAEKCEELVEKVVAHFPEMKLHFYVNGDGAEYQWDKISKNGVLVDYEPWCMNMWALTPNSLILRKES